MTPSRIPAIVVAMTMVAMASTQTTPYTPFQRPGVIAPGIDIKFIIRSAGAMWNQPRALDTLSYACEYVLPAVSDAIPDDGFPAASWQPTCERIVSASNEADPDTMALCTGVWSQISDMIPEDSTTGRRRRQTDGGMDSEIGEMLLSSLLNTTKLIYGVDPMNPDILTNPNIICGAADRFLLRSVPDQVVAFMTEIFSGYYLDLAKNYVCDNWSDLAVAFGSQADIYNDIVDVGAQAMGFTNRAALCGEIDSAITAGVTARKALAAKVVRNQLMIFTEAATCKRYTADTIAVLKRLFPAESGVNIDDYISGAGLNQYTGFSSIDEICDYMGNNFEYSAGHKAAAVSMSRLVAALMSLGVMVLSL